MKSIMLCAVAVVLTFGVIRPQILMGGTVIGAGNAVAHGGGCRKSSPPGQCCHMDNSTGTVHCH
jgi:hypothetical protein